MFTTGEDGISGAALVEFTLFAPLLVITSVYTMDFGLYYFKQMEVQNAAQASAQYAVVNASAPPSTDFTGNNITIGVPTTNYYCPSSSSPYSLGSPVAQVAACPDGSIPGKYITISAQATYTPLMRDSVGSGLLGLFTKSSYTLTGSATVRVQ